MNVWWMSFKLMHFIIGILVLISWYVTRIVGNVLSSGDPFTFATLVKALLMWTGIFGHIRQTVNGRSSFTGLQIKKKNTATWSSLKLMKDIIELSNCLHQLLVRPVHHNRPACLLFRLCQPSSLSPNPPKIYWNQWSWLSTISVSWSEWQCRWWWFSYRWLLLVSSICHFASTLFAFRPIWYHRILKMTWIVLSNHPRHLHRLHSFRYFWLLIWIVRR